jgi:allophanate hydrolase
MSTGTGTGPSRDKSTSAAARVHAAFARIAETDRPEVWISLRSEEEAAAEAASIDARAAAGQRLPLAGLVFAVKDNIDVAGMPTTAGCAAYAYKPDADAECVARLRAAGAIVIGKTNMDQFATGLVGTRSPFGQVRNAFDPTRISGGSSSGSAVAVALGEVDFALGTDTAGSGRVPAALNGIVGIKPTRGLVPTSGVVPACRSLDCVTVFAADLALARAVANLMAATPETPSTPSVAIPRPDQLAELDDAWTKAFADAVNQLRACGVEVVEADISPLLEAANLLYGGAFVAERYTAVGTFIEAHPDADLDSTVATVIRAGATPTAAQLFADRETLERLTAKGTGIFDSCDALLTPTTTGHPTLTEVAEDPIGENSRLGRYTNFANLMDLAAIAVPAGLAGGLPFGVMFTAPRHSDAKIAELAARFAAPPIQVAVFGAHLRGQPLNPQLVSLGGRYVAEIRTAAEYRMYALNAEPPKPGLVRVGAATGAAVEGELWSLPAAGFAALVAALPRPMAIGPVELADGGMVPGFLCEPAAIAGAEDITAAGSWRAHRTVAR